MLGLFFKPLQGEFGWSRSALAAVQTIARTIEAVVVYGLGFSGVIVMQEVVWANYFGRLSLGLVRSLGYLVAFGFGAAGPIAMNVVFDLLGSYRPAFTVIIGLFIVAAILMGIARPPKARNYATATDMVSSFRQQRPQ